MAIQLEYDLISRALLTPVHLALIAIHPHGEPRGRRLDVYARQRDW